MDNYLQIIDSNNLATDSLSSYLSQINRTPVLSAEEELILAKRWFYEQDLSAARQLVTANLRFVVKIARGYAGYGLPQSDLVQEGSIGLMKAIKRFDPNLGVRLISFAVHWIKSEINEYIIKNWRIVKIATTKAQRKLFFNLRKLRSHLGWFTPQEVTEIAQELGVKPAEIHEMELRLNNYDAALEAPANEAEQDTALPAPITYLEAENSDPLTTLSEQEWHSYSDGKLTQALQTLDARAQDIISSRWLAEKKLSLQELAAKYQVSAERIRQLEQSAMKKLKDLIAI